ncbi:hypothetical protein F4808DRAFT_430070 [Astrocystis sublimbata]|nr:hypothetical protein F4808DRAFT_430070 [Astrocystis sublimbata]
MCSIASFSKVALAWAASILFLPIVAEQKVGRFFSPPDAIKGTHDYSDNPVYILGETQTIKYTTTYPDYAITLWQQKLHQDAATDGPTIFSTKNGAVTQFDWQAQVYQFDLSVSNMFFLWLTPNSKASDRSDLPTVTSHYFNISDEPRLSSLSSSATSSTITTSSTQLSTVSLPPAGTTTAVDATPVLPTPDADTGELSTGAKAGVGVGAGLGGFVVIVLSVILFRRCMTRRDYQAPGQPQTSESFAHGSAQMDQDARPEGWKAQLEPMELGGQPVSGRGGHYAELSANGDS